jgi:hypothetical protein
MDRATERCVAGRAPTSRSTPSATNAKVVREALPHAIVILDRFYAEVLVMPWWRWQSVV